MKRLILLSYVVSSTDIDRRKVDTELIYLQRARRSICSRPKVSKLGKGRELRKYELRRLKRVLRVLGNLRGKIKP